ncbi:tetratricopeptide repeat protein 1 isoform X1 [Xyrichtys novacula]|uniref:Tetratricopeptide repeat protein 1 n=1 Tax=Xyrichtys novacula TaxID=13765 RepID=A0AAV1FRW9_XYRNO|nr:tetratricopeptide repeat protein 1 isoform X1 [Xyrichtys novacula]
MSSGEGRPREEEGEESEGEEQEEGEEDFYDCQENLQNLELRGGGEEEEERKQGDGLMDRREETERRSGGQGEETERWRGGQGEEQEDRQQDNELQRDDEEEEGLQEDSDSEMKGGVGGEVEFDDEYLREQEKELTEEEKESRRQESLTLKERGNDQFKAGDWSEAEQSYREALVVCPVCFSKERSVLFSNRAAARLHQGLKDQAIADCSKAIELNPDYVRALLRRAELYEQTDKLDEALEDYKKVLELDSTQSTARQACMRLPGQIQERNEKMKAEMLSKLKDLGNLVLRPFGLSTNNFQVNQDAQTGSYSINFVQSPHGNNNNNNNNNDGNTT